MQVNRFLLLAILVLLALSGTGCNCDSVPAAHVGVIQNPSGLSTKILQTGRHSVGFHGTLLLLEAGEETVSESYKILCADGLNIDFRVNVTYGLDQSSKKIIDVFKNLKPAKETDGNKTITLRQLWNTYLKPIVGPRTRAVVRPLDSPKVPEAAEALQADLLIQVREALKDTPLTVRHVTIDNIDLDPAVTERNKARIAIEMQRIEEMQRQQLEMLKTQNEIIRANKDYEVALLRAMAVADSQKIINGSITTGYLQYHYTEMLREVAKSNEGTAFMIIPGSPGDIKIEPGQSAVDAELLRRVQDVRDRVTALQEANSQTVPSEDSDQ